MVYNKKKALTIGIVWEQLKWGGVDSYLGYLLNDWPNQNDKITIFHNKENKGVKRLQTMISDCQNIRFVQVSSYFKYYDGTNLFSRFLKMISYLTTPLLFVFSARQYKRLLLSQKLDVVMVQNGGYPGSYGNISAIFGAAWAGIPVRTLVIHHAATKPNLFHGWFRLVMEKKMAGLLSSMVTVSNVTKETVLRNTRITDDQNCYITVIDNGIPMPENVVKKRYKSEERIKIGILGRLEPYKGHNDFLCALSMLSPEYKNQVKVELIGGYDHKDYQRIFQLINSLGLTKQVEICGYVDGEIAEIVRRLDLVAMVTNTFEGFGLTIIEALHNNVPVLATRLGIITELFPNQSPLIVEVGDLRGMATALEQFILADDRTKFIPDEVKKCLWRYDSRYMAERYREHLMFNHLKSLSKASGL